MPTPDRPPRSALPRVVILLGVVSLLTDAHSEMILALLPVFVAETLHGGALAVGLMEGLADLTAALVRLGAGNLSDRLGRRKPLTLIGYVLSTAAKGAWALAQGATSAIGIRVGDRVGKGLRNAPRDALIADAVPPEARGAAFGFHRTMDTAGAVLGVGIGFLLLRASAAPRDVMAWAAIPGVLAIFVLAFGVRERSSVPRAAAPPRDAQSGPVERVRLVPFLAVEFAFGLANASYAFFLLRSRDLGAALWLLPLLYLAYNVVYAATPYAIGRLADRFGRLRVLAAGFVLMAAALLCAGLARGIDAALWSSFLLFGLSVAATDSTPRAIVAEALGPSRRGTALGLHHAVMGVASVGSGLLFGLLWSPLSSSTVFVCAAALSALCAPALWLARPVRSP